MGGMFAMPGIAIGAGETVSTGAGWPAAAGFDAAAFQSTWPCSQVWVAGKRKGPGALGRVSVRAKLSGLSAASRPR